MAAPPNQQIVALQAAGFAMQVDLAPLATQAGVAAAIAPLATRADVAAAVAPLATQVQHAQTQVQIAQLQAQLAQILLLLAPGGVPAIAGAATAIVQSVVAARTKNAHDERGVAYIPVPLEDGALPPNWPAGFSRDDLVEGPIGIIDTMLNDYGLPHGPPAMPFTRRNALARHIGAARA